MYNSVIVVSIDKTPKQHIGKTLAQSLGKQRKSTAKIQIDVS